MATTIQRVPRAADLRPSLLKERRALLQRVLWSHQIEKSGRIRDFLAFVCEQALQDPGVEIHEQEIGSKVFSRDADYDTTIDNIVRVTASQARKKLDQYFASDGISEPVILEIPKGQYTPIFRERAMAAAEDVNSPEFLVRQKLLRSRRSVIVLSFCVVILAIIAVWSSVILWNSRVADRARLKSAASLNTLWSQLLPSSGRTDIIVSDSSLSLFQELLNRQLTLSEYLKFGQWARPEELANNPELKAFAELATQRGFTSIGSVTTAYKIAGLAGADKSRISILRARDFSVRQMKYDNVVLLGSIRANPWQELIEDRLNFRFGFDQKSRYSYFTNLKPRPGELGLYKTDSGVSYCRIAFVPSPAGPGNILSISGTETEGTEGGGEFVTSEPSVAQILSLPGMNQDGRLAHFEVLLKSSRVGGGTPNFTIVAFRLLQP